jgi:hypothetical protein
MDPRSWPAELQAYKQASVHMTCLHRSEQQVGLESRKTAIKLHRSAQQNKTQEYNGTHCWTNMRTRTKRTRGTENPDAFIRLNMQIVRVARFSFITHVERQLCIVN